MGSCRSLWLQGYRLQVPVRSCSQGGRAPRHQATSAWLIDIAVRTSAAPWFKKDARNGWSAMVLMPDAMPSPDKPCRLPLHWLPTSEQLADCLTKRLKVDDWWQDVILRPCASLSKFEKGMPSQKEL